MKRKTKKNQNGGKIRARKPHRQTPCTGMVPTKSGQRNSKSRINKHKGQETAREGSSGSFIKQEPSEHLEVRFPLFPFYKIKKRSNGQEWHALKSAEDLLSVESRPPSQRRLLMRGLDSGSRAWLYITSTAGTRQRAKGKGTGKGLGVWLHCVTFLSGNKLPQI